MQCDNRERLNANSKWQSAHNQEKTPLWSQCPDCLSKRGCEKLRVISKWRWRPPADTGSHEEWKLQRPFRGLRPRDPSSTWPGRPRFQAGAGHPPSTGAFSPSALVKNRLSKSGLVTWPTDAWEKFVTKGLCYGCGGDWDFKGALKVDINSSEYTGYKYIHTKPGYRIKARSCEDARFIHINYMLLTECRHFEKVSANLKEHLSSQNAGLNYS